MERQAEYERARHHWEARSEELRLEGERRILALYDPHTKGRGGLIELGAKSPQGERLNDSVILEHCLEDIARQRYPWAELVAKGAPSVEQLERVEGAAHVMHIWLQSQVGRLKRKEGGDTSLLGFTRQGHTLVGEKLDRIRSRLSQAKLEKLRVEIAGEPKVSQTREARRVLSLLFTTKTDRDAPLRRLSSGEGSDDIPLRAQVRAHHKEGEYEPRYFPRPTRAVERTAADLEARRKVKTRSLARLRADEAAEDSQGRRC